MSTAIETSQPHFTQIAEITALVLQTDRSHPLIDGVTAVQGYLHLAAQYPAESKYREGLERSIVQLAGRLAYRGHRMLAMRVCSTGQGLS